MKKIIILLLIITIIITGCEKKESYKINNPTDDYIVTDKGNIKYTYDNNKFTTITLGDNRLIKNEKDNYKVYLERSTNNVVRQEIDKVSYVSRTEYSLKEIKIKDYSGYVQYGKKTTVANIYLYINKEEDIVLNINITEIKNSNKKNGEDLYNNYDIQAILNSIEFKKI